LAARQAGSHQPENQTRRSHSLRASRWQGLTRYNDDGRIELNNNTVERSRKNALS